MSNGSTVNAELPFNVPTISELLAFLIMLFFVIAGLAALFVLLWGALSWVVSGGDKEAIAAARGKIIAALVGLFLIISVLTIIVTLEQVVFREQLCFGISCPLNLPVLLGSR